MKKKLIARIDGNGRCFVGFADRDNDYLKGLTRPVTVVRDEDGRTEVDPIDVEYAIAEKHCSDAGIFFAGDDVKEYYNENREI